MEALVVWPLMVLYAHGAWETTKSDGKRLGVFKKKNKKLLIT